MAATFQQLSQSAPQSFTAPTDNSHTTSTLSSLSSSQSSPPSASHSLSAPDLFWHATPRTPSNGMAALMAAIQQLAPAAQGQAPPVTFAKQLPRKTAPIITARRPQCTHMVMTRIYGHHLCFMCGKSPSLGWVYLCEQDQDLEHRGLAKQQQPVSTSIRPDDPFNKIMSHFAEELNMSPTVVKGIKNGDYSPDQVQRLIEQKEHLIAIIKDGEGPSAPSTPQTHLKTSESVIASVGARTTSAHSLLSLPTGAANKTLVNSVQSIPARNLTTAKNTQQYCNFQVCHHCRPFFHDRLYMNLESVVAGELPALSEQEVPHLKVSDANTLSKMDSRRVWRPSLPQQCSEQSIDITAMAVVKNGDDDIDDTSDWTPTSGEVSEADSQVEQYPCPGAGICPVYDPATGCAYDHDFDDGLRTLNHNFGPEPDLSDLDASRITPENSLSRLQHLKDRVYDTPVRSSSTASSISLPTPVIFTHTPVVTFHASKDHEKDDGYADSSPKGKTKVDLNRQMPDQMPSFANQARERRLRVLQMPLQTSYDTFRIMHPKSSNSSLGSEVEVEGGVALTEEAVQTGTPDIATDSK